jgi:hypothetical protein
MYLVWNDLIAAPIISKVKMVSYFERLGIHAVDVIRRLQTDEPNMVKYYELSD